MNVNEEFTLKTWSRAELEELIDEPSWWVQDNPPFSKARLQAYLNNPYAESADILWITASQGNRIVSYLGMVPDLINTGSGVEKMFWFSSWWIEPRLRGKGLAEKLTQTAIDIYPKIGIDSSTPWSRTKMYNSGNFTLYAQRPRSFWLLNLNKKNIKDFGFDNWLTRVLYPIGHFAFGLISRLRLKLWLGKHQDDEFRLEYIHEPDKDCLHLISKLCPEQLCVHDKSSLLYRSFLLPRLSEVKGVPARQRSYFGNQGNSIRSYLCKLWKAGKLVGLINIAIADGVLKLPFVFLVPGAQDCVPQLIGNICLAEKIEVIYSQNKEVKEILDRVRFPSMILKSYPMDFLLSLRLGNVPTGLYIQDGDGAF